MKAQPNFKAIAESMGLILGDNMSVEKAIVKSKRPRIKTGVIVAKSYNKRFNERNNISQQQVRYDDNFKILSRKITLKN